MTGDTTAVPRLTSRADVATDAPQRYAKQLVSHLGRRLETQEHEGFSRVVFDGGACTLTPGDDVLVLSAEASSPEVLDRVEDVVGRHLEKFGARVGLEVSWVRG